VGGDFANAEHGPRSTEVVVRQRGILGQGHGDVDAEAVDAAVEPEAQHVEEAVAHLAAFPVQVGLLRAEQMQIPLTGFAVGLGDAGPGGRSHALCSR
jgi:hypothetical protein